MTNLATRYDLTDLLADQCAHRKGIPDPAPLRQLGRPIAARYPGHCRACASPYDEGNTIRRLADDDGAGYLGPCCQEDPC